MRGPLVRVGFVVVAMSAVFAGSAIAANPGPPQFPLVPELVGSVRDLCSGLTVPGFVASLSDPTDASGTLESPSKLTSGGFVFQDIKPPNPNKPPSPNLVLHVSAPGYDPLGDPAAPNPGVPIVRNPGPSGRVTKNPGPNGLPGETRVFEGLNVAIGLMPTAGCAGAQHLPKVNAVSGKGVSLGHDQDASSTNGMTHAPTLRS